MSDTQKRIERPLSPHLQVYRPQMTSVLSILHRATGYALAVGTVMIVWMLLAAARGPESYGVFHDFVGTLLGKVMIFGWSVALFYHMSNGVRHMFWDAGALLDIKNAYKAGYFVLAMTVILTVWAWWGSCSGVGG